ncbi:MAG: ABC transporter substrate-binding protein [Rhodospirillales bacterium]|nr:ABC transporter substrate-binding protein [Rhodospirillales bacterium]
MKAWAAGYCAKPVRRIASLCLVLFTSSLLLLACGDPDPIKIGFIGGLSGRSADIGEDSRNAVQLAVANANRAGGIDGRMIELLVRDDAGDPDIGAEAVRDLHAAGVAAIIGPNISSIGAGMLPVVNELQVITISPTVSSLVLAELDDYFFRINWTTRDNAHIYADHYFERGIRRVAAAIDNNNRVFSESWLKEFTDEFEKRGGEVVASDLFDAKAERGYSDTAQKLVDSNVEAILIIANSIDVAQMAQQIRKLDQDILMIAAEWAASERLLFLGGSAIEGLEMVQSYDRNAQSDIYTRFKTAYSSQFQREPGYAGVAAHDAATVLFQALAAHSKGKPLKDALLALQPAQGLQQQIKFNAYGDAQRQAFFVVIEGGTFKAL